MGEKITLEVIAERVSHVGEHVEALERSMGSNRANEIKQATDIALLRRDHDKKETDDNGKFERLFKKSDGNKKMILALYILLASAGGSAGAWKIIATILGK